MWDEWAGWRIDTYVSGRQGERTVLRDVRLPGGGVLLELVERGDSLPLVTRAPDAGDGLFDALRKR